MNRLIFGTRESVDLFRNAILPAGGLKKTLKLREAPIFYFSHLFALFPFNRRNEKFDLDYKWLIFGIAFLTVSGVHSHRHVRTVQETEESNINILLYTSYALVNFVFAIACVIAPIFSRKSVTTMLKDFSRVDIIISRLHRDFQFHENRGRQKVQIYFTLGITLYFMLAYLAASQESVFPSFTYLEFYIMPVTWLIVFQLDYLLVNLRERFAFVNLHFKHFYRRTIDIPTSTLNFSQLNDLNFIHFTLYEISSKINNSYSVQLLVAIPRVIFFSVLPLHYNIVSALVNDPKQNGDVNLWSRVFTLSYIVLLISPIFYLVKAASITVDQAKEAHKLIHDLIDEDQEERIEYELLVFSVQLLHRKTEFSVKNFFSLKPSLTTAVLELIITYVIIILQFQDTLSSVSPIRLFLRPVQQFNDGSLNQSTITSLSATWTENVTESINNATYPPYTN